MLSKATTIEDAMKEWELLTMKTYEDMGALCICQHKIKHVWYVFNKETGETITVGSSCCKKFKLTFKKATQNMFTRLIAEWISENGYEAIDDIEKYAMKVKAKLIALCEQRANACLRCSGTTALKKLKKEIEELVSIKGVTYLTEILALVVAAIDIKTKQEAEADKKRQEQYKQMAIAAEAATQKRQIEAAARWQEREKQMAIAVEAEKQRQANQRKRIEETNKEIARQEQLNRVKRQKQADDERIARAIEAGKIRRDKEAHKFPAFIASLPPAQRFIQEAAAKLSKGNYDPTQTKAYMRWIQSHKILALTP
jgi:hypothetical protein